MPLEDEPGGAGVHWESRIAGPEVMSYGTSTGATYVSGVTLAFLEDTNHFVVKDWSLSGELVRRGGSTVGDAMVLPIAESDFNEPDTTACEHVNLACGSTRLSLARVLTLDEARAVAIEAGTPRVAIAAAGVIAERWALGVLGGPDDEVLTAKAASQSAGIGGFLRLVHAPPRFRASRIMSVRSGSSITGQQKLLEMAAVATSGLSDSRMAPYAPWH